MFGIGIREIFVIVLVALVIGVSFAIFMARQNKK
jgi:hypothetical protein